MSFQQKIERLKTVVKDDRYCQAIDDVIEVLKQEKSHFFRDWNMANIRQEILDFAKAMEAEMARHDEIEGDSWKDIPIDAFSSSISNHLWNLKDAKYRDDNEAISHDVIDIANYAMMIFHKVKGE